MFEPVGSLLFQANPSPPDASWLKCDGTTYNPVTYPDLFLKIGDLWGGAPSIGAWTARTSPAPANSKVYGLAYGGPVGAKKFVAIYGNTGVGVATRHLAYSADGITWTTATDPNGNHTGSPQGYQWVLWDPERALFYVFSFTFTGPSTLFEMLTSVDGMTWSTFEPTFVQSVNYDTDCAIRATDPNLGQIILATNSSTAAYITRIVLTPTVAASQSPTVAPLASGWSGIATDGANIVIGGSPVAGNPAPMMRSTDGGQTWTAVTSGTANDVTVEGIAFSPVLNQFLAVMSNGSSRVSNDGGATWSAGSTGVAGGDHCATIWAGSFFLTGTTTAGRLDRRDTGTAAVVAVATGSGQNTIVCATNGVLLVMGGSANTISTSPLTVDTRVPPAGIFPYNKAATGTGSTVGEVGGSFTTSGPSALSPTQLILGSVASSTHTHQAIPPYGTFQFFIKAAADPLPVGATPVFDPIAFATGRGVISFK